MRRLGGWSMVLVLVAVGWGEARPRAAGPQLAGQGQDPAPVLTGRPGRATYVMDKGELWNTESNFGSIGDPNSVQPSYSWPGGTPGVNNYYQWEGRFWIGAQVGGVKYVTQAEYADWEWGPSEENDPGTGFMYIGPGKGALDVVRTFDDYADNPYNQGGRHLGLKVIQRTMQWPNEPYNDFLANEFYITYEPSKADVPGAGPVLDSVFVTIVFDSDVCGGDPSDPHIDDLVAFDGDAKGDWGPLMLGGMEDTLAVLSDTTIVCGYSPCDGIPDGYFIWGDDPVEKEITARWAANTGNPMPDSQQLVIYDENGNVAQTLGYYYYAIPRNMSYIYDGDNPSVPGDDTGEGGTCAGYIGGMWLYAPPSPNDSTGPMGFRIIQPNAHQWWNWESDPPSDPDRYQYMMGQHPATKFRKYGPHPYDLGASEFDYRFLLAAGPFSIAAGETLKLVFIGAVGQGLSGGVDPKWRPGNPWLPGLRQVMEYALQAYYSGAQMSDAAHPSDPDADLHWQIPVPPPSPTLSYATVATTTKSAIQLVWDNKAEVTPDPVKGVVDFAGYAIYRALYGPSFVDPPIAVMFATSLSQAEKDAIRAQYGWENVPEVPFSRVFEDTTAPAGFPLFYAVTAFDWDPAKQVSVESSKDNYRKSETGAPTAVYLGTPAGDTTSTNWKDAVRVVPNPFRGSVPWSKTALLNEVEFQNLPPVARITILTLDGDVVRVIDHRNGTGSERWDLLNRNGERIRTGIYYYRVETPSGDYVIKKFLVLR